MKTTLTIFFSIILGIASAQQAFEGMTKSLGNTMIHPYGVEVTYHKTVHLIFPAAIKYVDLGSSNLIAGKATATENVLRIKAATENFQGETNFTVVCSDGSFYSFNARYAPEPASLNINMTSVNTPVSGKTSAASAEVKLKELGEESPALIDLIQKSIYRNNQRKIRHLGCTRFSIQTTLKGIYTNDGLLYMHVQIRNFSNVPFTIEFIRFTIADKKLAKRTAHQEKVIIPLRSYNEETEIKGTATMRTVFTLPKFTLRDDQVLLIEIRENSGGRHQVIRIENTDIELARTINKLKTR